MINAKSLRSVLEEVSVKTLEIVCLNLFENNYIGVMIDNFNY